MEERLVPTVTHTCECVSFVNGDILVHSFSTLEHFNLFSNEPNKAPNMNIYSSYDEKATFIKRISGQYGGNIIQALMFLKKG